MQPEAKAGKYAKKDKDSAPRVRCTVVPNEAGAVDRVLIEQGKGAARGPDYVVKASTETKLERVAGMWKLEDGDTFGLVFDDGVVIECTEEDRFHAAVFDNDWTKKFNKDGSKKV